MEFSTEILFSPFLVIGFLITYAVSLTLIFIYRSGLNIGVNCWFCNKKFRVPFSARNSFDCPYCLQYNGFNKDGDYNKVILAQHNVTMNQNNLILNRSHIQKNSNGLCGQCNRNMELKVIQLANYEPLVENNYDKEIEHFEHQLNKTYQLCQNCSKVLQNTIRKQNSWIFGRRFRNLRQSAQVTIEKTLLNRIRWNQAILFILSLVNVLILCGINVWLEKFSAEMCNFVFQRRQFIKIYSPAFCITGVTGFSIELLYCLFDNCLKPFNWRKFTNILAWIILGLLSVTQQNSYCQTLRIFCSLYLTHSYYETFTDPPRKTEKITYEDHAAIWSSQPIKQSPKAFDKSAELNEHFNELNIGAFHGHFTKGPSQFQSPARGLFTCQTHFEPIHKEDTLLNSSFRSFGGTRSPLLSPAKLKHFNQWPPMDSLPFSNCSFKASRSSSSSSGFVSRGISRSLPNSRENSPERNSLFSEPIWG